MTDAVATTHILSGNLSDILNFLAAAGGLGAAAMGLVDSTKAFWGGPSNFGFGYIRCAVEPFLVKGSETTSGFGADDVVRTLKANWLNGVAKADQKAKARSLIHLGLTQGNAAALAAAARVDPEKLTSLAQKIAAGTKANPDEIAVLGQFDAVVSAVLDAAYERGDQKYRNASKFLAMLVATALGAIGGWFVFGTNSVWSYVASEQFGLSLLVGLSATPLAPVAKDLASSLQAAVAAVSTVKR